MPAHWYSLHLSYIKEPSLHVHHILPDLRKLRKQPFKNKIHQFFLAVLGNEDDYVDVPTLMLKISNYH